MTYVLFFSLLETAKLENYLISHRQCLPEPLNLVDIIQHISLNNKRNFETVAWANGEATRSYRDSRKNGCLVLTAFVFFVDGSPVFGRFAGATESGERVEVSRLGVILETIR